MLQRERNTPYTAERIATITAELSQDQLQSIKRDFIGELSAADAAHTAGVQNETSIPYIVTQLPQRELSVGKQVAAVVIGGTVGRSAIGDVLPNGISLRTNAEDIALPTFHSVDDIARFIASQVPSNIRDVGINFAYPLRPVMRDGRLDGVLLGIDKTLQVKSLIGQEVGSTLENVLAAQGRNLHVSLINDGQSLLLAGLEEAHERLNLGFGIVGTGINFGFFRSESEAVILESHEFNKIPTTSLGRRLASQQGSPFGKEANGANLFAHFNEALDTLGICYPQITSTKQLDEISRQNIPVLSDIAQRFLRRSAQLVACQIAGIMDFLGRDMTFVMEGSLFHHGNEYRTTVEETVHQLTPQHDVRFIEVANSGLKGAAMVAA